MTGWSSKPEWPKDKIKSLDSPKLEKEMAKINGVELSEVANGMFGQKLSKVYNNKMPTHNPYANPNAQVYYECKCGAILDPGTKSFASLNNAASDQGWKVRWKQNGEGYEPFCVECGKDVE